MSSKLEEVSIYQFPRSLTLKLRIWSKVAEGATQGQFMWNFRWAELQWDRFAPSSLFLVLILTASAAGTPAEGSLVPVVLSELSFTPPHELKIT
jgi:hypothetical protein